MLKKNNCKGIDSCFNVITLVQFPLIDKKSFRFPLSSGNESCGWDPSDSFGIARMNVDVLRSWSSQALPNSNKVTIYAKTSINKIKLIFTTEFRLFPIVQKFQMKLLLFWARLTPLNFSEQTVPSHFLQRTLVILVLFRLSQFRSFGKRVRRLCLPNQTFSGVLVLTREKNLWVCPLKT